MQTPRHACFMLRQQRKPFRHAGVSARRQKASRAAARRRQQHAGRSYAPEQAMSPPNAQQTQRQSPRNRAIMSPEPNRAPPVGELVDFHRVWSRVPFYDA
jgi:hypothetical protein